MKNIHKRIETFVLATALLSIVSVAPVSAEATVGDAVGSTGMTEQTTSTQKTEASSPASDSTKAVTSKVEQTVTVTNTATSGRTTTDGNELESRAKLLVATDRKNAKEHTVAQRQQFCQEHKADIATKANVLGNSAQTHLSNFNAIFTKVQAYQAANKLAVSNYDNLVADVTATQSSATTAVATLQSVKGGVTCTSTDPATTLAQIKTAADDARNALQAYRQSLKSLVDAMLLAKPAAATTADGGMNR